LIIIDSNLITIYLHFTPQFSTLKGLKKAIERRKWEGDG
jgi:hypothetical protein